ncbi:hypothetical protein P692DRAFT_20747748 [Suillus brevipes Sb2]|nr:hypothetical protein P692DRAFT_20747748 [Suillus brevipes Sb2]
MISLDDPDYALYYYRATRIDPTIKEIVAAPILKRGNNNQADYKPYNVQNGQNNRRQNDNRNLPFKKDHSQEPDSITHRTRLLISAFVTCAVRKYMQFLCALKLTS